MIDDLIPFVGFDVEKIEPEDKVNGLDNVKTNYRLLDAGLENELGIIKNFKELKTDNDFQTVRKFMKNKDYLSDKQYKQTCKKSAEMMRISTQELTRTQRLTQQLSNIVQNNKQGRFDRKSHEDYLASQKSKNPKIKH